MKKKDKKAIIIISALAVVVLALAVFLIFFNGDKEDAYNLKADPTDEGNTVSTDNGMYFDLDDESKTAKLYAYHNKEKQPVSIIVPRTINEYDVVEIGPNCFADEDVKEIEIHDKIKVIDTYAFQWSLLTEVDIPSSVLKIGKGAFQDSASLKKITIPTSVVEMGDEIFVGCSDNLVIFTEKGSVAERYAKENNIKVQYIK